MKKYNFNLKEFCVANIKKIIIAICSIAIILIALILISNYKQKGTESSTFSIKQIILYNNANVINSSNNPALENLSICQYSDLSVYINNNLTEDSTLTDNNTIKKLYIDNISIISKNDVGTQALNYKSPASFGKYAEINNTDNKKIDFNIITLNANNHTSNYNTPSFYTDCSNPITLGYLNTNIIQNYSVLNSSNKVSYNAKILKEANINLEDINNTISFTIHIVTNSNEKFYCNVYINLSLDEDFLNNGYSFMSIPIENGQYKFYRE